MACCSSSSVSSSVWCGTGGGSVAVSRPHCVSVCLCGSPRGVCHQPIPGWLAAGWSGDHHHLKCCQDNHTGPSDSTSSSNGTLCQPVTISWAGERHGCTAVVAREERPPQHETSDQCCRALTFAWIVPGLSWCHLRLFLLTVPQLDANYMY